MQKNVETAASDVAIITVLGVPARNVENQSNLQTDEQVRDIAISVEDVRKVYPQGSVGIDAVTFRVAKGEIFGLLGPNGAGKSTLIRLICGLIQPTSGRISIGGVDPHRSPRKVKALLCGLLQGSPFEPNIRVLESLRLFSKFYKHPLDPDQLLELVGLSDKRMCLLRTLSGGQRQRLAIARALVGNPQTLVLDEPTTGLDVAIRHELMTLIRQLRDKGRTVLISTHYIEEAEQVCDRVAILCRGRLFAVETPEALVRMYGKGDSLELAVSQRLPRETLMAVPGVLGVQDVSAATNGGLYRLTGHSAEHMLQQTVLALRTTDIRLQQARVVRSGLEGAYLQLTGERIWS